MTRSRTPALAAVALAAALACTKARQPGDPTPLAVNPSRAPATASVRIEISGRDLDARVKTDLSSSGSGRDGLDAGFAARLEPATGPAVALADVRLTERRTLLATVPAGLPAGSYRLVVTDPAGRTGALAHAYRVVSSPDAVARFEVTLLGSARAGVGLPLSIAALDAGGNVVDGFDGTVTVSDTAGAISPVVAGPFVLGRCGATVTVRDVIAGDALVARDAAGHTGTSAPFDALAGPPVAVAFPAPAVSAAQGACSPRVALELRDASGHPAQAEVDLAVRLQSAPPGLPFFADAACTVAVTSLTVAAGSGAAAFHFRGGSPGDVTVRALAASLPSAVQVETVTP